jgi:nicotinamidase-related amidase
MKDSFGRKIYETDEEIFNKSHTALIVWDVQNMLVNSIFNKEEFLKNTNSLIEKARKVGIPIIYTRITPLPERFQSKPSLSSNRKFDNVPADAFELAVKPAEDETVIRKNTASLFIGTNIEMMLRNAGIESLIFTGIATEYGVESSAREALNRGFYVVVAKDAVSSQDKESHERSLLNMQRLIKELSSAQIGDILEK